MSGSLSTSGAADAPAQLYNMVKSSTLLAMLIAISLFFFFDRKASLSRGVLAGPPLSLYMLPLGVAFTTEMFEAVAARCAMAAQAAAQAAAQVAAQATKKSSSWARSLGNWRANSPNITVVDIVILCMVMVIFIVFKDKMREIQLASAPAAAARAAAVHVTTVPAAAEPAAAAHMGAVGTGVAHVASHGDAVWPMSLKGEIKSVMRQFGVTQVALARDVGTSQSGISTWLKEPVGNNLAWTMLAWLELKDADAARRVRGTIPTQ
jgi:hypothetical protein